ncbi:hypothetical protein IPH25_01740 [bacterium]|nr:MAG: hypothetical protein IPG37_03870 [bacterium]QQR62148.1 MAG: hypothetical protein IPH25_01740 [bacterium]QQR63295.1 MAG: hypothetical protein IPH67_02370 [bacterium]
MKKYILLTGLYSLAIAQAVAESTTQQTDETKNVQRTVLVTKCSSLQFGALIDQKEASEEERARGFQIISDFVNNECVQLKNKLEAETPHIKISLGLVDIVEDVSEVINIIEEVVEKDNELVQKQV